MYLLYWVKKRYIVRTPNVVMDFRGRNGHESKVWQPENEILVGSSSLEPEHPKLREGACGGLAAIKGDEWSRSGFAWVFIMVVGNGERPGLRDLGPVFASSHVTVLRTL